MTQQSKTSSLTTLFEIFIKYLFDFVENLTKTNINPDRFAQSNYYPQHKEVYADNLKILGKIPQDISGAYIRTGPNTRYFVGGDTHAFEGDGMLHAIKFDNGKVVAYTNHFVQTDVFKAETKWNRPIGLKFSQIKGVKGIAYALLYFIRNLVGVMSSTKPSGSSKLTAFQSNTSIYHVAGRLLSFHEADLPYQIRMLCNGMLETLGSVKMGKAMSCTAHPHTDFETKETFFFRYNAGKPFYQYSYIDAKGKASELVDIDIRKSIMTHDFSITSKYAIFLDVPLVFDPMVMVTKNKLPYEFKKDMKARFGLLPRYSKNPKDTVWFELPNQYIFHVMNSYDVQDSNQVKMFACRYDQVDINNNDFETPRGIGGNRATLTEYIFDLDTKKATQKDLISDKVEFPQVDQSLYGKKFRYGYCSLMDEGAEQGIGFIKYDLSNTKELKQEKLYYPPNTYGGEVCFVASRNQKEEDDGYLMGYLHNYTNQTSSFVIYDAKLKTKDPLAEVLLPQRVPYGFHGNFFDNDQLKNLKHYKENIEMQAY